ncbi:hypothetical protein Z945_3403 [Sulfitobacter noctilucae]|nr:hypothetical protein Z945_3403 [Sulfitobacter noctilucae]
MDRTLFHKTRLDADAPSLNPFLAPSEAAASAHRRITAPADTRM